MSFSKSAMRMIVGAAASTGISLAAMGGAAMLGAFAQAAPLLESRAMDPVREFFRQRAARDFSGVILIDQGGRTIFHEAYGRANPKTGASFEPDTVFDIGSITKRLTATAVFRLEQEGKLGLDDPLQKFFPNIPADKSAITVRQLLFHDAGFPDHHAGDRDVLSRADALKLIFSEELEFAPGTGHAYSNTGYTVLAAVIEEASGTSYLNYLEEMLRRSGLSKTADFSDRRFDSLMVASAVVNGKLEDPPSSWPGPTWSTLGNGEFLSTASELRTFFRDLFAGKIVDKTRVARMWPSQKETKLGKRFSTAGGGAGGNAAFGYYPEHDLMVVIYSTKMGWKEIPGKDLELIIPAEEARDELEVVLAATLSTP